MSPTHFLGKWARKCTKKLHSALSFIVFIFLDLLESILCMVYRYVDGFLEGKASPCYCGNKEGQRRDVGNGEESEVSDTLHGRKNLVREMGLLGFARKWEDGQKTGCGGGGQMVNRWSDCGCESCLSWMNDGGERLHVVMREPSGVRDEDCSAKPAENVIFLHGFLCSSSFWTESVFRNLSEPAKHNCRLLAIDLLGFGRSPKPMDCLYTLRDHLEMIEKSVIKPYDLKSFHLVAHSMGCLIALPLAAKYSKSIKSVTLVAPPYFLCSKDGASLEVLKTLAGKKLWPPEAFHSSLMSWYEHLGRSFCFIFCRNHRIWERILKLVTRRRKLHFMIHDLTKHTHHSAWHNMHNVICGGAKFMDGYLEILNKSKVKICIIHGDCDKTVPLECSYNLKRKVPHAEVKVIANATHCSVIRGRKKDFAESLENIWGSIH